MNEIAFNGPYWVFQNGSSVPKTFGRFDYSEVSLKEFGTV